MEADIKVAGNHTSSKDLYEIRQGECAVLRTGATPLEDDQSPFHLKNADLARHCCRQSLGMLLVYSSLMHQGSGAESHWSRDSY